MADHLKLAFGAIPESPSTFGFVCMGNAESVVMETVGSNQALYIAFAHWYIRLNGEQKEILVDAINDAHNGKGIPSLEELEEE